MAATTSTKLGLALSGGGFRASLFHIGVLAALAEREMLHKVEVISTVSGGSIIGAYYYLKVKRLLEGNRPGCPAPTPDAYRRIVAEIERDFLAAVQKNIRLRLLTNPFKNAKMLREDYSRSDRMAELLNRHFYDDAGGEPNIALRDIHIKPGGVDVKVAEFNAGHEHKIPILILNATSLNTGHTWHFTGAYVGEPAPVRGFVRANDSGYRLPILRFDGRNPPPMDEWPVPEKRQSVLNGLTLAEAVVASAAVPGVFSPLSIHNLYRTGTDKEIVVELCDGGVFDNQGVDALYEKHCTHFVISDAAGQIDDQAILGTKAFQVALRANEVMMDKIRGETLYRVDSGHTLEQVNCAADDPAAASLRAENGVLGYALAHTRQAFANSAEYPNFPGPADRPEGTIYRLSCLRTDLDAFSDAEAYSLMYDGYNLAHEHLAGQLGALSVPGWQREGHWRFLAIRDCLTDNHRLVWLHKRLKIGARQFFRPFFLTPWRAALRSLAYLLPLAVALWLALACYGDRVLLAGPLTLYDLLQGLVLGSVVLLLGLSGVQEELKRLALLRKLRMNGGELVLYAAAWLWVFMLSAGALLYLWLFNPLFLKDGKIEAKASLER
ncbi:MAG: patatin-like phospholipase family protein [Betaproteobacteria bacterium]|nr:patatin-like phospholipase family protein [Betaproteobacteria bacterium]